MQEDNFQQRYEKSRVLVCRKLQDVYKVDAQEADCLLLDYELYQGVKAVDDMAAFLEFCEEYKVDEPNIIATIKHDINGRSDKSMLPRTHDYRRQYQDLKRLEHEV